MDKTKDGHAHHGHGGKHEEKKPLHVATGIISITSKGVGYVVVEGAPEEAEDIEIPAGFLNTALHKDEVEIRVNPKVDGLRVTGEVSKILKRAKTQFVGTIDEEKRGFFLIPDDRKMYMDIFIPKVAGHHAKHKDKALVEITHWTDPKKNPEGKVLQIIGTKGENNAEMNSIVIERGFATDFPAAVEREAEHIEATEKNIPADEIAKRRDFRNTLTFTIDPFDAKDFDDAISFKRLEDGTYEIGVHIADVSHYVREGSELDREARERGFSVYLVDRTIPMLPEVLSNDICSLNPNEDKLTFSAVFIMNDRAEVISSWYGKTIINSDKRFTYENAQEVLDAGAGEYFAELDTLNKVAKILQKNKFSAGAIDFETTEIKFVLDEKGKPIRVIKKERKDTHKLVEEYMLLANRGVAEYVYKRYEKEHKDTAAFIYRIHDVPDVNKIKDLSTFLKAMGYELHQKNGIVTAKDISKVLDEVAGKPEESLIKTASIRSMAKAVYSTRNIGHFGLAYKFYTHFTSPIRRYADLLVHRLLQRELTGGKIEAGEIAKYERIASHSTEKEIAAADAERTSIKYKQVEFMEDKVGKVFDGVISGVTEWGIYVEDVETKAEGMVRLRDLTDDFYSYDKQKYALIGQKSGKRYQLGDKVKYKITKADMEAKTLDMVFV